MPGRPHVLRMASFEGQKEQPIRPAEVSDLVGRRCGRRSRCRTASRAAAVRSTGSANDAAGLQDARRFAQVAEDDVAARDVLEDGVGVDEVELRVGEQAEVGAGAVVRVRVGSVVRAGRARAESSRRRRRRHGSRRSSGIGAQEAARDRSRSRARRRGPGRRFKSETSPVTTSEAVAKNSSSSCSRRPKAT